MTKLVLRWVQSHADANAIVLPGGVVRFALHLSVAIVVAAETADILLHLALDAFGLLPYPLTQALAVGTSITFVVAGLVGFFLLLVIGTAIRSLAINRNEFRRLSITDELSGLLNRRAFFQAMHDEPVLSLILFDIDHFKAINDQFGHAAGDEVIREVSRRLVRNLEPSRTPVGRLGEEEFGVLLTGRNPAAAATFAETLRSRIADGPVSTPFGTIPVTVSGGVAGHHRNDAPDELFRRCDEALYAAKHAGRNRMVEADAQAALEPVPICG